MGKLIVFSGIELFQVGLIKIALVSAVKYLFVEARLHESTAFTLGARELPAFEAAVGIGRACGANLVGAVHELPAGRDIAT
jgi:hypothetical protein